MTTQRVRGPMAASRSRGAILNPDSAAQSELWSGNGQGAQFGWFANRDGIDSQHDQFITAMIDAMATGSAKVREIADALRRTAEDFGATDTSVADEFHNEDGTPR